jgi:hypothetical protein
MIHTVINGPWGTDKLDDGVRINIKAEENTVYSAWRITSPAPPARASRRSS